MKQMELRFLPSNEFRAVTQNGKMFVEGYVNLTDQLSAVLGKTKRFQEKIAKGAFAKALREADSIDFLSEHKPDRVLSTTVNESLELEEDDKGLYMKANISATTYGNNTFTLIKDGIVSGMSFGMKVIKDSWTYNLDGMPIRTIEELALFEVSAVRYPAYPSSYLEARGIEILNEIEVPTELELREDDNHNMMNDENKFDVEDLMEVLKKIDEKIIQLNQKQDTLEKLFLAQANPNPQAAVVQTEITKPAEAPVTEAVIEDEPAKPAEPKAEDAPEDKPEEDTPPEETTTTTVAEDKPEEDVPAEDAPPEDTTTTTVAPDETTTTTVNETRSVEDVKELRSAFEKLKLEVPEIE